jgi:hypothetical protein
LTWALALLVVAACCALGAWLRIPALGRAAVDHSRRALRELRDPGLGEAAKERAAQAHAGQLLLLALRITAATAVAVALPFGALALLSAMGWVDFDAVLAQTISPWFALVAMALVIGALWLWRGRRP